MSNLPAKNSYLLSLNYIDEACKEMVRMLNDEDYEGYKDKSKHELWMDLAKLLINNPNSVLLCFESLDKSIRCRFNIEKWDK